MMELVGRLAAICRSEKKGTEKTEIPEAVLRENWGIEQDAHAGLWHRQVSLLAMEEIEGFRNRGADVAFGAFGENLVTEGLPLKELPVGSRLQIGDAVLEITQIGKECHSHCAIFDRMGECIMPREGIFAKVIKGGSIRPDDEIRWFPIEEDRAYTAAVITLSDRSYRKEREDKSGPLLASMLTEAGYEVTETILLPDEEADLKRALCRLSDQRQVNVIFTTGGTGFAERDRTPEATEAVCDRKVPGIGEVLRANSLKITDRAVLSRQTAGIRKKTLIVNLPGSPKAVKENLEYLLPMLPHGLGILRGTVRE